MKAFILAAGVGSRLSPITDIKPKCLVRVAGKPILSYQIEAYLQSGLAADAINVVGGYRVDMLENYLKKEFPGVILLENDIYDSTNNMYSLYFALKKTGLAEGEAVIINNGDCIYDKRIIDGMVNDNQNDLVAVHKDAYLGESMKVEVVDGNIKTISKEIPEAKAFGVSIDLYRLSPPATSKLQTIMGNYIEKRNERNLWTEVALQDLFKQTGFTPYDIKGNNWIEIDNHDDLVKADRLFSDSDLDRKECFVCDLDGTVYLGNLPVDGTIRFIKEKTGNLDFFFLTNNTSKIPDDYVARLKSLEIATDKFHIIAPHIPLIKYLREKNIKNIFLVANKRYRDFLLNEMPELQINSGTTGCRAVLITYDTELTYDKLKQAALILQKSEIKFLATHADKVCPTEAGPVPDIGSFLTLLKTATGRDPDIIFGKPNQELLFQVLKKYDKEKIVIVGDRLYTDKVLADNAGIDFVLVLSGESNRTDAEKCETGPKLILNNLGDLLE